VELLNLDLEFTAAGVPNCTANEDGRQRTGVNECCVVAERETAQNLLHGAESLQTTYSAEHVVQPTYVSASVALVNSAIFVDITIKLCKI
jgi:hypothetical protein